MFLELSPSIHLSISLGCYCANTIRYDTIAEFNVDSKAEYKLNLAHVARD